VNFLHRRTATIINRFADEETKSLKKFHRKLSCHEASFLFHQQVIGPPDAKAVSESICRYLLIVIWDERTPDPVGNPEFSKSPEVFRLHPTGSAIKTPFTEDLIHRVKFSARTQGSRSIFEVRLRASS
jgi:hypothetical protein